ncbi:MAG TPA: discoidin domain-containing protein [Candidatus Lumbricidophila sp.]|nr:discoidin domain-containing protein [Candidatus Lumbricidophila sp.]
MSTRRKSLNAAVPILAVIAALLPAHPAAAAEQAAFYVSPSGSDTNPGTQAQPFATIEKARDAVRLINDNMTGDITVNVGPGNYYVNNTIRFDENDSGTNGHQVTYRATGGVNTAKFIGGNKVGSAWSPVVRTGADADLPSGAEGSVYKTYVGTGVNFNTLYVNDDRAVMARTKNLSIDPRFPSTSTTYMLALGGGLTSLQYNSPGTNYTAPKAVDGSTASDWASNVEGNPWIQLNWGTSQAINKVTLHDRANSSDWSKGGALTFSDGSSVDVSGIPNDGTAKDVTFATKNVTWVKFQVAGSTGNNGLAEFKAFNTSNTNVALTATPTVSSEFGKNLDATSEAGLVNAQARGDLDAQIYVWDWDIRDWMTDTIPVGSVNPASGVANFKQVAGHPETNRPHYAIGPNARFVFQGNLGFLDAPGEYYFNKTTGYLYYYPKPGTGTIDQQDIVIPKLDRVIEFQGASRATPVTNITFDGLQVKDTNFPDYYSFGWNYGDYSGMGFYPPEAQQVGVTQPSYAEQMERMEFQNGVIQLTNTDSITLTNLHVYNAGMMGINLFQANQHAVISNTLVNNIGNNGIQLEGYYPGLGGDAQGNGYNSHNTVTNTIIHDVGQLVGSASGLTVMNSGSNTLSHLEVFNSSRRGIFISGGYSRNPNYPKPDGNPATTDGDRDYNPQTDLYARDNRFTHIYLHDAQQDGGDDGAFFACWLYGNLPNYIDQMLIDRVGANPSMRDIAPNGVNFDMGQYANFEVKNFRSVNPQHYNFRGFGKWVNTNVNYNSAAQLNSFDDSQMEYSQIGVQASFPAAYLPAATVNPVPSDVYFNDAFETGVDWTKWNFSGNMPTRSTEFTSEGVRTGKGALKIDSDGAPTGSKPVLYRNFGTNLNKIVSVKLFDRQNAVLPTYDEAPAINTNVRSLARVDNQTNTVALGIDTDSSTGYYVFSDGATTVATTVPRSYGWHDLKFDYSSGTNAKLYIDGVLVKTLTTPTSFSKVSLGSDSGVGVSYYDQLYIHGGTYAAPPATLTLQPQNLAPNATVTGSSQYSAQYALAKVNDGIVGQWGSGEWASAGESNPWVQLTWANAKTINKIVLNDRPNSTDWSQGGTLTFSDGSSLAVAGIPNNGSDKEIDFPDKTVTWVKFQVAGSTGTNGLSEFEVYNWNLAKTATITASSEYNANYVATKVADGVIGVHGSGEWASANQPNPWIQLDWTAAQTVNKVVLYDRVNTSDWSQGGTLTFSDGSSVAVAGIPNNGTAREVTFADRSVTWVRFQVAGSSGCNGLSEIQVLKVTAPNLAPSATPTASSEYSPTYAATKLIDGVIGQNGSGEWAKSNADPSPWAQLTWASSQSISKIVLFDRANSTDQVLTGTLTFSDGSSVSVGALNNAGTATEITFPTKNVTWVKFQINTASGLPGLSEFQAY